MGEINTTVPKPTLTIKTQLSKDQVEAVCEAASDHVALWADGLEHLEPAEMADSLLEIANLNLWIETLRNAVLKGRQGA